MKTLSLTAFNRPQYLEQFLKSLEQCLQFNQYDKLFIQLEPGYPKVEKLCRDIKFIETSIVVNEKRLGVRQNPFTLLERVFNSGSTFNVYLEDDILLSPDALDFMDFYYQDYSNNHGIMCSNLYNYESHPMFPNDLCFSKDFVALGVGIFPFQWDYYFKPFWFDENIRHEMKVDVGGLGGWDWSIRAVMQKYRLHILAPKWSRSVHRGRVGTYCDEACYKRMFEKHPYCEKFIGFFGERK